MLLWWSSKRRRRRHTTVWLVRGLIFLILQSGFILQRVSNSGSQSSAGDALLREVNDAPPPPLLKTRTTTMTTTTTTTNSSSIPIIAAQKKTKQPAAAAAAATAATAVRRQQQQQQQQQYEQLLQKTDNGGHERHDDDSSLPPVHVYVMAGQSNMVGYGSVEHLRLLLEMQQQQKQKQPLDSSSDNNNKTGQDDETTTTTFFTGCGYPDHRHLWNEPEHRWTVLDRITVVSPENPHGRPLSVGLGKNASYFGPELGFAWALANNKATNDNDNDDKTEIVLIKTAWNEKSLAVDFRPPSAGNGTYLNYKGDPIPTFRYGDYYRAMRTMVRDTILHNLTQIIASSTAAAGQQGNNNSNKNHDNDQRRHPKRRRRAFQIKGFVWFQGWNDQNEDRRLEYASNLAHLIRDVRRDVLNVKEEDDIINEQKSRRDMSNNQGQEYDFYPVVIPVVVGETGQWVKKPRQRRHIEQIRQAQEAVTAQPEFCASTRFVRTHHLVHPGDGGGGGGDGKSNDFLFAKRYSNTFHFSGHADTVYAIGCAMGEAMLQLQQHNQQHGNQHHDGHTNKIGCVGDTTAQT